MKVILRLIMCFLALNGSAQGYKDYTSARHGALGGASTTLVGNLNSLDNQGTLGRVEDKNISLAFKNDFFLEELNTFGLGAILPTKVGVWGANLTRFGNQYYSQNNLGLAFGKVMFKKFNFGMRLNFNRLQQNEYGNANYVTVEMGFLTPISDNFSVGAHVYNPLRTKINTSSEQPIRLASALRIGANYSVDKVTVLLDLESNTTQNLLVKAGVEYHAHKLIDLRFGVNYPNQQISAGVGINTESFEIDFYYQQHAQLGASAGTTLTYAF